MVSLSIEGSGFQTVFTGTVGFLKFQRGSRASLFEAKTERNLVALTDLLQQNYGIQPNTRLYNMSGYQCHSHMQATLL